MEKPKAIWIMILLWIVICIFLAIHIYTYYLNGFVWQQERVDDANEAKYRFVESIIFFILIIICIYGTFTVKKWSRVLNLVLIFGTLVIYGRLFFSSVNFIVFSSHYKNLYYYYDFPHYTPWLISNLLMPFVLLSIAVLIFYNKDVKKYFNQNIQEV